MTSESELDLASQTDEKLNELFAVEVAEIQPPWTDWQKFSMLQFTTDANAVLPHLQKSDWFVQADTLDGVHQIHVGVLRGEHGVAQGTATTFARAAVIALLEAKRQPHNL